MIDIAVHIYKKQRTKSVHSLRTMKPMTQLWTLTAVLLVAAGHQASAFANRACLGADSLDEEYIFAPSPVACDQYVLCMEGEAHIDSCPPGHHFNAPTQNCPLARDVDCIGCARIGRVNLRHPEHCDRFYECTFGHRVERTCPEGLLFDRSVGECNLAQVVDCGDGGGEWPEYPEGPAGPEQPGGPGGPNGPGEPQWPGIEHPVEPEQPF